VSVPPSTRTQNTSTGLESVWFAPVTSPVEHAAVVRFARDGRRAEKTGDPLGQYRPQVGRERMLKGLPENGTPPDLTFRRSYNFVRGMVNVSTVPFATADLF
jgi:hypothetical protein